MSLTVILGALELGGIFAILSLGLYISYKILNLPDLTVDGSFTLGCAVGAVTTVGGYPFMGLFLAFFSGCLAGTVTAILITKFEIMPLLSGILTMTGLYTINLIVMGDLPTISLFLKETVFTPFQSLYPYGNLIFIVIILVILVFLLNTFLKTQVGLALRATGDNEDMVRASSIDADKMKLIGLAIANGCVALAGAVFSQHQTFADINSGVGMMVIGLASIIVGMSILKSDKILFQLIAVILGSVVYRGLLTVALQIGLPSSYLKLLSAVLVVIAIASTNLKRRKKRC